MRRWGEGMEQEGVAVTVPVRGGQGPERGCWVGGHVDRLYSALAFGSRVAMAEMESGEWHFN